MALTPAGKLRLMKQQQIANPMLTDQNTAFDNLNIDTDLPIENEQSLPQGDVIDESSIADEADLSQIDGQEDLEISGEGEDLGDFLFDMFVNKYGYEPRILHGLKSDFIEEELGPDDNIKMTVTLPSSYWKTGKRISAQDVKEMVDQIKQKFHVFHHGSKIGDETIVMELSTIDPDADEKERDAMDNNDYAKKIQKLYDVYGKDAPGSEGSQKKSKKAYTMQELIKMNHNRLFDIAEKIVNKK